MERLKWLFLAIFGHFFQFWSPYDPDKSERKLVMTLNSSTITKHCLCKVSALKMVSYRNGKDLEWLILAIFGFFTQFCSPYDPGKF